MAQSFINENMINENTCELFMNDVMYKEYEINPNLQIESNQKLKYEKNIKKIACLKNNVEITLYNFFMLVVFCVNDNKDVDLKCPQTMKCIFCYSIPILFCNPKT